MSLRLSCAMALCLLLPRVSWSAPLITTFAQSCQGIDAQKVERLLAMELGALEPTSADGELRVELSCQGESVRITVAGLTQAGPLTREITLDAVQIKERVIALSAAQIVAVTRLEAATAAQREISSAAVPSAERDTEVATSKETVTTAPASTRDAYLSLAAGAKLRAPSMVPTGALLVRGDFFAERAVALLLMASFEGGVFHHSLGNVSAFVVLAGLGPAWRVLTRGRFFLEASAAVSAGYAALKGYPEADGTGRAAGGLTAEACALLSPQLLLGPARLSLDLGGGYIIPNPTGRTSGEASVSAGGPWVGGFLRCVL